MGDSMWMFERGAAALAAALQRLPHAVLDPPVEPGEVYLCPLCLVGFGREQVGALSKEHAPPKALGGKVITLTCIPCNNGASAIQGHAARRATWQHFAAGDSGTSRTVTVRDHQGATVTANLENRDGVPYIFVDDTRSNPTQLDAMLLRLRDGSTTGVDFTLTGDVGFVADHAHASDLRDAYLAAFALLGYRYILWPDLDDIRRQIADGAPNNNLLWRTDLFQDFQGLITLTEPVECVGVITPRGRCVFLPWPNKAAELSAWLDDGESVTANLAPRGYSWPHDMPMLLDLPPTAPTGHQNSTPIPM